MQQQPPQGPYQGQQPPYYPQGPQPYYPPQPGMMRQQPPPRKPRNRNTLIGCGTLVLLLIIIGSCNAILTGGRGLGNTDDTTANPAAVATIQPHATVAHKQQPTDIPASKPTHAVPTTVAPTAVPTQPPAPTQAPVATQPPAPVPTSPPVHAGVNGNPWGYDFTPGNLIYNPPTDFCTQYFTCVTTFWKATNGYVSQCANGLFTHSGGVRGECSRDGGKGQILYSH